MAATAVKGLILAKISTHAVVYIAEFANILSHQCYPLYCSYVLQLQ